MKFSEKLIKLRKENHLSQEQLASMLDVSRQSVSKWESGQTYPEMDKLLSLCKIFKCTLDELTNDEISEIDISNKGRKKTTFVGAIYDMLELINKSISMFKTKTFQEICKIIFEMLILVVILFILKIPFNMLIDFGLELFAYLKGYWNNSLGYIWSWIINAIYFILFVIVIIYIFKVRFVDTFEEKEEDSNDKSVEEKKDVVKEKNISKNDRHSLALFNILGIILLWMVKFFVLWLLIPLTIGLVIVAFLLVIDLSLMFKGVFLIGASIGLISLLVFGIAFFEMLGKFLCNLTIQFKRILFTVLITILTFGMGCGIFILEIANINYHDAISENAEMISTEKEFKVRDNTFIGHDGVGITSFINNTDNQNKCFFVERDDFNTDYNFCLDFRLLFVEDNSLKDSVKIKMEYSPDFVDLNLYENNSSIMIDLNYKDGLSDLVKGASILIKDLRSGNYYDYDRLNEVTITVTTSKDNRIKMSNNAMRYVDVVNESYREANNSYYQGKISELNDSISELRENNDALSAKLEELERENKRLQGLLDEDSNN